MLGYNMYAYCNNNPVNYVDYTGEFFAAALRWWTSVVGPLSMAEPTVFGEIAFVAGAAILAIGKSIENTIATIKITTAVINIATAEKAEDPPKSVTSEEGSNESSEKSTKKEGKNKKDYVKLKSNKEANKIAKKLGYKGAEDLKSDFVKNISQYNMYRNRITGEIILIGIKTAKEIFTDLFTK